MSPDDCPSPKLYAGVMVSSTFTDLKDHRTALIKAIKAHGLTDVAMDNDSAKLSDVIDSSLQMVRDSSAYIGVVGKRYGQTPKSPNRNPDNLSITELEFNEALRLGRPILLFIMGDDHLVREDHIEAGAAKKKKLKAFRERAKKMSEESSVHRIYAKFDSLEEFKEKIGPSIAELRRHLDSQSEQTDKTGDESKSVLAHDPIPKAPAFYAEPAYIGSHKFIGRQAQLDVLNDWAQPADPHSVLLFEAIGGNGKSMLTWEWTTKHANKARIDWAGRFWYSFYERGAIMADFCQHALAYMTGQPLEKFHKQKTTELAEVLLHHLRARPWLFILDGLERVLVAYHRIDAAEIPDEEANTPTDKIVSRDPCAAIRPEDDDLLRSLASAAPSKILVSSRLVPRVLLNAASQSIPGVQRISLPGLRPTDAESLLRSCGITGNSQAIQHYLTSNCDCHPLVIGVLAGLINDYLPDKGNFDAWAGDPTGGGQLNLANLDLVQKRNHILKAGLDVLPQKSRQLLSTLALLSEAVDYPTLLAFNPHLPPGPELVEDPDKVWYIMPDDEVKKEAEAYKKMSDEKKKEFDEIHKQINQEYQTAIQRWKAYEKAIQAWQQSVDYLEAPMKLAKTVPDLERRGLLQYDARTKRYDLHPVIRGVSAGGLQAEERDQYGQRVVDHFSGKAHNPCEDAKTLDDLRDDLNVVRTLIKMGRFEQAYEAYIGDLSSALIFNLEAYAEVLSLLRTYFPKGWDRIPETLDKRFSSVLANDAALMLRYTNQLREAQAVFSISLLTALEVVNWKEIANTLRNISLTHSQQNNPSRAERVLRLSLEVAVLRNDAQDLFMNHLFHFANLSRMGQWAEAKAIWLLIDPMGRSWTRQIYRPGMAEHICALFHFKQGTLQHEHLVVAERFASEGKNRQTVRDLHSLRGEWLMEQRKWALAAKSFTEAVRMAREIGTTESEAETQLALTKLHLGQLLDPRREAEQLSLARNPAHQELAELWLALGDREQAKKHALAAYKWAWADGEPYVRRYELNKATALLKELGTEIPKLPSYDPAKDEKFPWEDKVAAAIEKLRAEK